MVSIKITQVKSLLFALIILIIPLIFFIFFNIIKGVGDRIKLDDFQNPDQSYIKNQKQLITKRFLTDNPINSLLSNSMSEFFRVKSFDKSKKMIPLVTRPEKTANDSWKQAYMNSLCSANERINDSNYLALRTVVPKSTDKKHRYNIVIMFLETWENSSSCTFKPYPENPTPFFDKLKKESVVLENFMSNSQASYEGETAVSHSIPAWGIVNAKYTGLLNETSSSHYLNILKNHGYETRFITSWDASFKKMTGVGEKIGLTMGWINPKTNYSKLDIYTAPFALAGIENISELYDDNYPIESVPNDYIDLDIAYEKKHKWKHKKNYIADEFFYDKLHNTIQNKNEPFFLVTHNCSSHMNMPLPNAFLPKKELESSMERYYYSMRYSDAVLKNFFEKARNLPQYKNTIFILLSDHANSKNNCSLIEKYKIPALIFAPGILKPQVISEPTFHVDIGPTIINLLNLEGSYTSFGTSVFSKNLKNRGMILPDWDGYLVYVRDSYILKTDLKKVTEFYNYKNNPDLNLLIGGHDEKLIKELFTEFQYNYTTFADSIYANRIAPIDIN